MIYICADDYGLCESASKQILHCVKTEAVRQVSAFANFQKNDYKELLENPKVRVSLHLNLVEGKCMSDAEKLPLIVDHSGNFKHTFGGLLKLNLFHKKELEEQVYREIKAQMLFWKSILPSGTPLSVDSHQHTHMIPAVFRALVRVLRDEKIAVQHLRIPAEPILPYLTAPSLYLSYSPANILKQWLLKGLWQINKKNIKDHPIPTALFFGILFSGRMDEKRVSAVLPAYIKLAKKENKDIEILFHPGYMDQNESDFPHENIVFHKFYLSKNRKTEFDSIIKLSEGSVL